ncbi:hypothetical protein [Mucilaginibacter psychrotolerans]|uniref:Uncharacterized protein n=1 Tax=Mucilaginibacter psychrotolerans TaxID=1524096 RepID=A0A4Y8SMC3_9SPHI|nr:hypothetical protein [Mucilaginibacter psychrotolerans]TFF40199.1 hypothetical protein E2R66_02805 [Mucilaginibacter psychrotolerans]
MENKLSHKQPWLHSPVIDGVFILSPPFVALLLVVCFPAQFQASSTIPVYYWLFLVVFIDVAHVYSTLYRTYFIRGAFKKDAFLIAVPIACYIVGVLLHNYDGMLFWRTLAYLAVFHFIRQQYGFMRLYSRQESDKHWFKVIDKIAIYTATIYPLFYWHFEGNRNFSWFVENDILSFHSPLPLGAGSVLYLLIIVLYVVKEGIYIIRTKEFNGPRNLLIAGTFLSWYFGIVYFNGDMAFTTLNVVSHGIPYMALIWIFEKKKQVKNSNPGSLIIKYTFSKYGGVLFFVLLLALLAYMEEGLWDGMIWKEHGTVFKLFSNLPKIGNEQMLSLVIPLLALPQSTHYILDGFIWKVNREK